MTSLDGGAGRVWLAWTEPAIINTIAIEIQKRHSLFNLFKLILDTKLKLLRRPAPLRRFQVVNAR
jgi:hypothetical protein